MRKDLPSPELLRKLLRYEPDTGKLFWIPRPAEMFSSERTWKIWNTRYAGKEALSALNDSGYKHGYVNYVKLRAHRVIWAMVYGEWPKLQIDHINGDRSDNRICNLRHVSSGQNQRNMAMRFDNSSGHNGVHRHSQTGKWVASIRLFGKRVHLGCFDQINDAVMARKAAELGMGFTERHGL